MDEETGQLKAGDRVALFVGNFNPPTIEHFRAIEAVLTRPEINRIWIAPLSGENDLHVRAMVSILAADFCSRGKIVSNCTVGLDKKMSDHKQIADWVRTKFQYLKFQLMTVAPETAPDIESFLQISFGQHGGTNATGSTAVILDKYPPVSSDLKLKIQAGMDESRNFIAPIWSYLVKNKLYRG